jgi:hypothetical protein
VTAPGFLSIGRISHRAALIGRVIDRLAQTPLAGVEIAITAGPPAWQARVAALRQGQPAARPERRISDAAGFFHWLDLAAGAYTLGAAVPGTRYAVASATATVGAGAPARIELALAPTAVTGTVRSAVLAGPLGMARVRFADSGEVTYTAADGSFTLSPVEAGANRALEVSAQNHVTTIQAVTLPVGQLTAAVTITLARG